MFNKINQVIEIPKGRVALGKNQKGKGKLTQFLVHRMIKQNNEGKVENHSSSYILTNIIPSTSHNETNAQKEVVIRRDKVRTEQSNFKESFIRQARTVSRWYCEPKDEIQVCQGKRQRKITNYKVILPEKSDDIVKNINERVRKIFKTGKEQLNSSQETPNLTNFGLSITQIKKLNNPKKYGVRQQKKQVKVKSKLSSITRGNEGLNHSSFNERKSFNKAYNVESQGLSISQEQGSSFLELKSCNNKELMIKKLNQAMKFKKSRSRKREDVNSFQKKMLKMFECLDLILNSYHCRINWNKGLNQRLAGQNRSLNRKQKQKYHYYIGGGNNSNLIRSLMRKRSWWAQVESISKASFVWTQLRVPAVIERCQKYIDDWNTEVILFQQMFNGNCSELTQLTTNKSCISPNLSENQQSKEDYLSQIFHNQQSILYHQLLETKESQKRLEKIQTPQLIHNHYQHNYMFGNKNALYYNLSKYCQFSSQNLGVFVPLTFYLEKNSRKSMVDFEKIFNEAKSKNIVWILKPAQNSNRGKGIEVTSSLPFIKSKLNVEKKLIVQYYIKNLLLYNHRKFDIRTYMIAVTINGRQKFYWYDEGYLRTSSEYFDTSNLTDEYVHLTNDSIQKNGQNYGKYEEGNKLSYSQFQRYLDSKYGRESIQVNSLHQKMEQIAKETIKATYCRIDPQCKKFSFQLFGLDFIIDNQFKPFLIEVNTNPCLELSSPVLERLIPRMMENMFRLCVDPIFRPNIDNSCTKSQSYYLYDESFLERNKFALIFDQKYDRNFQWEERCQKMRGIEWSQEVQQYFEDEGSLILVDY